MAGLVVWSLDAASRVHFRVSLSKTLNPSCSPCILNERHAAQCVSSPTQSIFTVINWLRQTAERCNASWGRCLCFRSRGLHQPLQKAEILASVDDRPRMVIGRRQGIYLKVCHHLRPKTTFIHCHCARTTLVWWNISQWVCYGVQNPHRADTFISLSVRSICFRLHFHFSVRSRSVKWIFPLPAFVLLALTSFHLLILSFMCISLQVFLLENSQRCSFFLDLWLVVCFCCLSQGFSVCLFCSHQPSHLFVSFAQKIALFCS